MGGGGGGEMRWGSSERATLAKWPSVREMAAILAWGLPYQEGGGGRPTMLGKCLPY